MSQRSGIKKGTLHKRIVLRGWTIKEASNPTDFGIKERIKIFALCLHSSLEVWCCGTDRFAVAKNFMQKFSKRL